jgi:putative oxidoreductase
MPKMIDEIGTIDENKLIIPKLGRIYRHVAPLSYAFLRIVLALVFLQDGIEKLFLGGADRIAAGNITKLGLSPPYAWAWTVAGLDFFGSILLGLGLFTRPVAVAFLVEVTVISFRIAAPRGFFWTTNGAEITLLMAFVFIGFIFGGGGRYSVDRLIGREF